MKTVEELAGKVLGTRTGEYKNYNPGVLAPVPRNMSIAHIGVTMESLQGGGFDVWYAYEFRCLTNNGLPIAAALKFIFPHTTKNIIESKSLKLYCNSFTAEKMGETKKEALERVCKIVKRDLTKAAEGEVEVSVVTVEDKREVFEDYVDLMTLVDPRMKVCVYNEDPTQLEVEELKEEKEYRLKFDALRSTCRLTKQPDSGSAYIYYKSKKHIVEESLVRYLASFYSEHHFHEEILITLFKRLSDILNTNDSLECCMLYQRRGSLDIGPIHCKNMEYSKNYKLLKENGIFAYDPKNIFR